MIKKLTLPLLVAVCLVALAFSNSSSANSGSKKDVTFTGMLRRSSIRIVRNVTVQVKPLRCRFLATRMLGPGRNPSKKRLSPSRCRPGTPILIMASFQTTAG